MIDALVERVQAHATRVALELQWELAGDDDDLRWELELHVVIEAPGRKHSRYSTVRLHGWPAETLEERQAAHRIARAVADRTRLALHAPSVEDRGGQGESGFLRAAPAGDPVGYPVDWTAAWWTTDGRKHEAAGTERVDAASGEEAERELERRLLRWPFRPISIGIGRHGGAHYTGTVPTTPTPLALRSAGRATPRASAIARAFPAATPLALMVGFSEAFHLWLEHVAPLAAWRAGELSDAALDRAIELASHQASWLVTLVIEERWRAGQSVAAYLREVRHEVSNRLALIRDLREVFDLGLRDAEAYVHDALERARPDAELDAMLQLRP